MRAACIICCVNLADAYLLIQQLPPLLFDDLARVLPKLLALYRLIKQSRRLGLAFMPQHLILNLHYFEFLNERLGQF